MSCASLTTCMSSGDDEVFQITRPLVEKRRRERSHTQTPRSFVSTPQDDQQTITDDVFVQPMNLVEPNEDILGYTRVCTFQLHDLAAMRRSALNSALRAQNGNRLASFIVRIWSRASCKYVSILESGAVYGRSAFGPSGHIRLIMLDDNVALLQSSKDPSQHLAIRDDVLVGSGMGGRESRFLVVQNNNGFCTLESIQHPGCFLGVRKNGNIMWPRHVIPDSVCAHFLVQKEALCVLPPYDCRV